MHYRRRPRYGIAREPCVYYHRHPMPARRLPPKLDGPTVRACTPLFSKTAKPSFFQLASCAVSYASCLRLRRSSLLPQAIPGSKASVCRPGPTELTCREV